jgi:hypothetical protein
MSALRKESGSTGRSLADQHPHRRETMKMRPMMPAVLLFRSLNVDKSFFSLPLSLARARLQLSAIQFDTSSRFDTE